MASKMVSASPRRTLRQLWHQGWTEIPEIMAGTAVGITGIILAFTGTYRYYQNDGDNKPYKNTYVIMRPDDPRVSQIRKDSSFNQ